MANLIIKPTSGGSLILQDEGGTAANTIDASGNTQLAGTLGVTGNATLSGTGNNLGTTTAGTLSSGVIFPAGHVIKYVPGSLGTSSEDTTSGSFIASPVNNTITFTAGNYIYAQAVANFYCTLGGQDTGGIVQMSTNANDDSNDMIGNLITVYLLNSANNPSMRASYPCSARIQPSGTSVTVTLKYKAVNGGTLGFYKVDSFVDLWEIKA